MLGILKHMDNLEEIKNKIDIVSLISEHVQLSRSGRNFKALCPFHSERTPSFIVSPELQIWRCFGACQEGGDIFKFLMKLEGMEFPETVRFLANRAGIKLNSRYSPQQSGKEKLYKINADAANFYHYILTKHSLGQPALSYLKKERGIGGATIEAFQLGFSPKITDALPKFLMGKQGYTREDLVKSSLMVQAGTQLIDRFHGRIIFPLRDLRGNTVGFSGRILPPLRQDSAGQAGKYINSPETLVYQKRRHLFGVNVTRNDIKSEGFSIVVEGEFDLLSLWQAGIKNVVAIKGTAFTQEQAKLLSRLAPVAVMALDSDTAGEQATKQGILLALSQGLEVEVATLGTFKDPDEAVRVDPGGFKKKLKGALGAYDFFIENALSRFGRTTDGVAKISRELVPVIASIKDRIVQAHYVRVIAERLRISEEAVAAQVSRSQVSVAVRTRTEDSHTEQNLPAQAGTRREILEEHLVALALQTAPEILLAPEIKELINTPVLLRIINELEKFTKSRKRFDQAEFFSSLPAELEDRATELLLVEIEADVGKLKLEIEHVKRELAALILSQKITVITQEIKSREDKKADTHALQEELSRLVVKLAQVKR